MNEQAIQDAYNLFKTYGYDKSQDEFLALISSNPNALQDAYKIFSSAGYNNSMDDFKTLMGIEVSFDEEDQKEAEKERAIDDAFNVFGQYGYDKEKDDFIDLISSNPKAFKDAYDLYSHSSGYNKPIEDFAALMGISPDFQYTEVDELKKKEQSSDTGSSSAGYLSASATTLRDDPNAYEQAIQSLSPEYIGLTEEEAAPLLSRKINDALGLDPNTNGFKFEETGVGDYIKVIAPNLQEIVVSFDNQDANDQLEELTILQDFIRLNKPSKAEVFAEGEESQDPIPAFVEEQISAISPKTMGMTEEYVVPEMNYRFGPLGFRFEETGMLGDYMTVTAPNGEQIEISLDNFRDKSNVDESNKLKEFIERNTKKISNLASIESEYTNENKRFATEEDYNKAIEDVNLQSTKYRADMQSFLIESDLLNKEREQLKDITDPTQYKAMLDQIEQKQITLDDRKKSIDQRQVDLVSNAKMIEQAIGKYGMAKSLQGDWSGGIWDATLRGVGRIATGAVGAFIDIGYSSMLGGTSVDELDKALESISDKPAAIDEQKVKEYNEQLKKIASGEQEPYIKYSDGTVVKYTGEENPSMIGAVAIAYRVNKSITDESKKIPMPTEGQTHGEWYNSLTQDQKQLLVDKSNDELKKDLKRNLLPAMREGAEFVAGDDDTTVQWADLKKKGFWGGAVLGVAESLPAMVGSNSVIGWAQRTASMYAQSADAVYEEMERDPEMRNLSETEKAKVVVPIGLAVGALETIGLRNVIANKGLLNKAILGAIGKSTSTTTAKTFGELVKNEIKSPLLKGSLTLLGAGLAEGETGAAQQIAELGIKDIYNASQDKKLFQTPETTAEYIKEVAKAGAQEMIGGFMLGSIGSVAAAYSKGEFVGMDNKKFSAFEAMAKDDKVEKAVVADLKNRINQGAMTVSEGKEFLNNYRNSRALYAQIPDNITIESKKESMQLLSERAKLENQIKGKDQSLTAKQRKRIGEINTQLEKLSENAVQESTTNESLLRERQPSMGLSQMAQGNKIQILDDEEASLKNQIEQALSASSAPTITVTNMDGTTREMSRDDASTELDRITTKQFEFETEVVNELLDAAARPVDSLTASLEASPTDAKMNITFMQEDGTETFVMGNERMLANLYQTAVRVNPLERTEQQQSIVNAVDATSQLAATNKTATPTTAQVNLNEVVQTAMQHGVSEEGLYRALSGRIEPKTLAKIISNETTEPVMTTHSPKVSAEVGGRGKILFQASNKAKFDKDSLTLIQKIAQRFNMNVNGFSPAQVDENAMSRELARFGLRAKRAKPSEFGSYGRGVYIVDDSGRVFNPFKAKPLPQAAPATAPVTETTTEAAAAPITEQKTKPSTDSSNQLTLFQSTSATPDDSATDDELNNVATLASISPKNFRDLYRVNRELFGLNRLQALSAAVIGDRMIGAMAQRAGITKQQMYEKVRFDKTDERIFIRTVNTLFQGSMDGQPATFIKTVEGLTIVNGWYSKIERNLRETKIDKQSANKWLSGGIIGKGDEAVYTGVRQWLESKNPQEQVSKQEILDWMKNNRVEIVEVVKGGKSVIERRDDLIELQNQLAEDGDYEGVEAIERQIQDLSEDSMGKEAPKFSRYQLEGKKKNYKEVLVTLPSKGNLKERWGVFDNKGKLVSSYNSEAKAKEKSESIGGTYKMASNVGEPNPKVNFKSIHFDEPNILVHLRMNTRTDADGNKVLFLEEVQSDWGQTGKKEGFSKPANTQLINQLEKEKQDVLNSSESYRLLNNKTDGNLSVEVFNAIQQKATQNIDNKYFTDESRKERFLEEIGDTLNYWSRYSDSVPKMNQDELSNFYDVYVQELKDNNVKIKGYGASYKIASIENKINEIDKQIYDSQEKRGIPTAPFVTDTNAWTKLGLKIALREAVSQGADKIAWTTGEQQFDRWGTEKIDWSRSGSGWTVNIQEQFRGTAFEGMNVDEKALSESGITITSKEDLKEAIDETLSREKTQSERQKLTDRIWDRMQKEDSGTSLPRKEGMEAFYDRQVPSVASSLVKELTGEKVELGTTQLEGVESTQQSIDITPEITRAVNSGMPLFQSNQAAMQALADGTFIVHALTNPNVSSPLHELAHIFEHYLTEEERNKIIKAAKTQGWTTETSEYFARGFEKYLATGVSPIPQLTKVFAKFKQWLTDIYDGITDSEIDVKLNKEMKAIYDKMLQEDESIEKIPGYKRMIVEIQGIVMKSIERGRPKEEILKNAIEYLKGSAVYQRANDVQREQLVRKVRAMFKQREKSAPSVARILGTIKNIKKITMTEKAALAFQIRTLARGARDAMSANKRILREVSEKLSEMEKNGKITLAQMSAVINRFSQMNPFSDTSVESFVEYMANVFENANHAQRMSVISKMLAIARKVQYTKLGIANELSEPLKQMLALNPYIIPTEVLDAYEGILKMLSEKTRELSLQRQSVMTRTVNEVLDAVSDQNDKVVKLTDILDNYEEKVFNEEGNLSFAETLAKMIKEDIITEDDARIMKKFKSKIMRELFPAEPETEESKAEKKRKLEEEKSMVISIISRMTADVTNLGTQQERELARTLLKMIKNRAALNGLDLKELYNLYNVIHNINNGFFSAYANTLLQRLDATAEESKLDRGITGAKPLAISTFYARLTTLFKKSPDKFFKLIERGPKYFIDQAFGNFKTKDIFDSVFRKISSAMSSFRLDYKNINDLLDKAKNEVSKSYRNKPNSVLMSSFKMMTYMLQLEYESNEGNDEVNPAHEYLKKTIEKTRDGETKYSDRDADMLESILRDYTNSETKQIDINRLYDSFNEAEKKAIKTIQEINTSLTPIAVFVSSVIRGDKIRPITNYIHHSVLQSSTEDQSETASSIVSRYNNSMNPSTRAKTLLERTKGIKPLNFDVFSAASKSSKYLLMDLHLTPAIRTVRMTLNGTKKRLKERGEFNGKNRDIFNAIERSFNETVSNALIKEIEDTTVAEQVVLEMAKQGYRAVLASTGRFVAELTSNLMFAAYHPADFVQGMKMRAILNSKKAVDVIRNLKASQANRIYPSSTLSGSMIDDNIMSQAVGMQGGTSKSDVANVIQTIYNNSLKKYKNSVEVLADTLISTPDKIVMRPVWFGTFFNYFKELTGMEPDLDKIADNDEAYMTEYSDALEKATRMADERSMFVGASDNPFLGIGKNNIKANASVLMKSFVMFNSYMTRFMIYEYTVARTGIYAAMGNGSISKAEGVKLLAAVTTRMTVYSLLMKLLSGGIIGMLFGVDDEEEKDDKSLMQMLGQSLTSTATSLLLGRDFGNATRTLITYGTEKMNEKFLDDLREGEYNYYEDNIQYNPLIQGDEPMDYLTAMSGPYAPAIKTFTLIVKKATDKEKKQKEAIKRSEQETKIRIPLEIFGNLGLVPLYKEIRKTVNDHIYKDLKKKMEEKGSDKSQKGFFDRMTRTDLKRYYPEEYNKRYGPGTPEYYKNQRESLERKQERAIKDMQYNYVAPPERSNKRPAKTKRPNYRINSSFEYNSNYSRESK